MKLATFLFTLCATCTAITVAPAQHPKPQLQQATKASKALALRGGVAAATKVEPTSAMQQFLEFRKLFRATDGLIVVFFWSLPYLLAAIPGPIGEFVQKQFFETVYLKEDAELAYIRWEVRRGGCNRTAPFTSIQHNNELNISVPSLAEEHGVGDV